MMGTASRYPHLFSPIEIAGREIRNRIALPATLTNYGRDCRITDRWTSFLVERARGGAGLIVSEIVAVDPEAVAHPAIVTGYDAANEPGFERTAAAVHAEGGCLVGQLWHPGRQQLWQPTRSPVGVSEQPDALSWTVPHVMDAGEIERLVARFIGTAMRLSRCGFAGVELHGAHGYLITQFLSPWSNDREDRYGGSLENRARFCLEIAAGIRAECGSGFIIGLKLPADEGVEAGIDPDEAARLTAHLAASGHIDYFAYGQGNFSHSLENHVPDMHFEPGHFIDLHRRMRDAANGVPVMALGRIGTPALAERVVGGGYAELVGMTRAQISDAAFAAKARDGRADEIRPCVFNNFCWGEVHAGKPLAELHNPHLGEAGEAQWHPVPCATARHVVVVGTGVAGLEAAWVAASRGHRVTLLGASDTPGGKARLEASLPGHAEIAGIYEHQLRLGRRAGVRHELGTHASAERVRELDPDVVVLAAGSEMRLPEPLADRQGTTPGAAMMSSHEYARALLAGDVPASGKTAVLFDHDHTAPTYAVAISLAARFERVVLLTPRTDIAQAVNYCSGLGIHRRLHQAGIEIMVATTLVDYHDETLWGRDVFSQREWSADGVELLVYATPRRANDSLARPLEGIEVRIIGDALAPRNMMIAIHEGHAIGNEI